MKGDKPVLQVLKEEGYRLTPQRIMVVEAVEASHDHTSAEEMHAKASARYPYLNISTVYRTLELLRDQGLAAETDLGGGRLLYHPVGKAHHHHLICRLCGNVRDIGTSAFREIRGKLRLDHGFHAEFEHIAIFGTCRICSS